MIENDFWASQRKGPAVKRSADGADNYLYQRNCELLRKDVERLLALQKTITFQEPLTQQQGKTGLSRKTGGGRKLSTELASLNLLQQLSIPLRAIDEKRKRLVKAL